MKLLLLLVGLSIAFFANAQNETLPHKPMEAKIPDISVQEALRNSVNPRYMVLKDITPVYHQPADTTNGRYVFKLPPGMKVFIREKISGGFLIDFGLVGERYYLPAKSVKGLQTFVEI